MGVPINQLWDLTYYIIAFVDSFILSWNCCFSHLCSPGLHCSGRRWRKRRNRWRIMKAVRAGLDKYGEDNAKKMQVKQMAGLFYSTDLSWASSKILFFQVGFPLLSLF
ncbi:hypothetical protein CDL12_11383 [Handroanthus impetiginosus]|uniref:Uncharacterized protein n=1 Tax=Handroanthus impetiginosus TaxID=429701 RepID=A0A2G9HEK2_9LAMI|nr:hypothetical protein CDL12_11383 [Handroanthus impetiginosus]